MGENKQEKYYLVSVFYYDEMSIYRNPVFITQDKECADKWTSKFNRIVENNFERIKNKGKDILEKLENGEDVDLPYMYEEFAWVDDMRAYVLEILKR